MTTPRTPADRLAGLEDAIVAALWKSDAIWQFGHPKRLDVESRFRRMAHSLAVALEAAGVRVEDDVPADYWWCHRHGLDVRTPEDHCLHENDCRHFAGVRVEDDVAPGGHADWCRLPRDHHGECEGEGLRADVERIATDTLGLFLEYRDKHGYEEHMARVAAVAEVIEGESERAALATPAPTLVLDADEGLRAALRAVLRDFDREPTEEYLDEAVRIFREGVSPAPTLDRERLRDSAVVYHRPRGSYLDSCSGCGRPDGQVHIEGCPTLAYDEAAP